MTKKQTESRRRDRIAEILDQRARRRAGANAFAELRERMSALWSLMEHSLTMEDNAARNEIMRHVPVAAVASIEGFFKATVAELIDEEPVVLEIVRKLDLRLDWEGLVALNKKSVTLGEVAAHSINISRLDDISGVMESVLGVDDYRAYLKNYVVEELAEYPYALYDEGVRPDMVEQNTAFGSIVRHFDAVDKAFEWRHALAHEMANGLELIPEEVETTLRTVCAFLEANVVLMHSHLFDEEQKRAGGGS